MWKQYGPNPFKKIRVMHDAREHDGDEEVERAGGRGSWRNGSEVNKDSGREGFGIMRECRGGDIGRSEGWREEGGDRQSERMIEGRRVGGGDGE